VSLAFYPGDKLMQSQEHSEGKPRSRNKRILLKAALLLAIILILLVIFVLPWFVSSEGGRNMVLGRARSSVDGEIDFTDLSMSWWRGIEIGDFSFKDGTGGTFVRVKQITTKPHYISIITGSLSFGKTEILEPRIEVNLIRPKTEVQPGSRTEKTAVKESQPFILPIEEIDVVIKDGSLKVTDATAGTVELSQINSEINLRRAGEQADFDINLAVVDGGKQSKIQATGKFNLKRARGELAAKVDDLSLSSLEPIFAMAGVNIQADGNIAADVKGEIKKGQIERLNAAIQGSNLKVNIVELTGGQLKTSQLNVNVNIARADEMINIESLDISADWLKAEGRGTIPITSGSLKEFVSNGASLNGHFELDAAQALAQMPELFGLREGTQITSGMLKGDIKTLTEGETKNIRGQASLLGLRGMVGGKTIALSEPVLVEARIAAVKGYDWLSLSSGFAKIDFNDASGNYVYNGNVDLAKLQAELGQFVDAGGYGIAGEVSGQGDVSIKESEYAVDGLWEIKNLRISHLGKKPFEQREVLIDFDVEAKPAEKIVNVNKLEVESDQIKIHSGKFNQADKGDKTKLQGQAEIEYDWAAVSSIADMFLPAGLALEGQRKDTVSFVSEYPRGQKDKMLGNLNSSGKLGFTKGSYFGLNFGPTEVDIKIEDGMLEITPFSTTVNNGRLNFAAKMDLRQKPIILQTSGPMQIIDKVEINERGSQDLLVYLNPIFKDQADITGIANFHSEKLSIPLGSDTYMQPEIIGTVGIENIKLETKGLLGNILSKAGTGRYINAAVLPTKFVLREGKLSYDNMQINLDKYPTNFVGSIGPKRILDMTVITPYVLTKDFGLETVKIGEESNAERFPLPLTGTIDNPQPDWGKLGEWLLKQQLKSGRLGEEIEGIFERLGKGTGSD